MGMAERATILLATINDGILVQKYSVLDRLILYIELLMGYT